MRTLVPVVLLIAVAGCQHEQPPAHIPATPSTPTQDERPPAAQAGTTAPGEPAWWCAVNDDGIGPCDRRLQGCQQLHEIMTKQGIRTGECAARASAYCFVTRGASGDGDVACTATLRACQGLQGSTPGATDCAEQR